MKKCEGTRRVNDDEWYTPYSTAVGVVTCLKDVAEIPLTHAILCPADLLLDGTESAIPKAFRDNGFTNVRVTRDLPLDPLMSDYKFDANDGKGELIVTNPPFSLLVPLRKWLQFSNARICILARPSALPLAYTLPLGTGGKFSATNGKAVCAAWFQNLVDTRQVPPDEYVLGNCADCVHNACPKNIVTGDWSPGRYRKLYGWGKAAEYGIAGKWCHEYTTADGKKHFTRFFF